MLGSYRDFGSQESSSDSHVEVVNYEIMMRLSNRQLVTALVTLKGGLNQES
jgi:hypothetical protein